MDQQHSRVGIDIRPRILGLSVLCQNPRHNVVHLRYKLEERIIGHVLESEFSLAHIPGIRFSENRMSKSGNDLSGIQGVPAVFLNVSGPRVGHIELSLHVFGPPQNFLVGKSVKRSGKPIEARREG